MTPSNTKLAYAKQMDEKDPLRAFRQKFKFPQHNGSPVCYFTGNSLGLQPVTTQQYVQEELEAWGSLGVEGHFHGKRPWMYYHKFSKQHLAALTGALPLEVVSMGSLTANLHALMVSFYRPTKTKFKIIAEEGAFPSDQYLFETQIKFHGYDPDTALVELSPKPGKATLDTDDIVEAIATHADSLALVLLSGVQYYSGQLFDIPAITKAGHKVGAIVGFDLAHTVGNVPLQLHEDGVDFAAWCSYKYLNSGPGAVAGIFVHEKHAHNSSLPRFAGWWGNQEEERFLMQKGFRPMEGADGWQMSNVNVLSSAALLSSLEIFHEAGGMEPLRKKSILLTNYLEYLILNLINSNETKVDILTPSAVSERGAQLSLVVKGGDKAIFEQLSKEGIIADWREPNVIRIAPVPLYNSFEDVHRFCTILNNILS